MYFTAGLASLYAPGMIMGGSWAAAGAIAFAGGALAGYVATGTGRGALTGAFTSLATFGIASGLTGGDAWFAQSMTGGITESLSGGKFGNGFAAAGLTAAFMPQAGYGNSAARSIKGALIGGTISELTGGKFANGAVSGAIQGAMSGETKPDNEASEYQGQNGRAKEGFIKTGDLVPEEKRQSYVRNVMRMNRMTGADSAIYTTSIPPDCASAPACTSTLTGIVEVYPSAFNYTPSGLGSILFHESIHAEQWARGGIWRTVSWEMNELRQLEAYTRQLSYENPYFLTMGQDNLSGWWVMKEQHLMKVKNYYGDDWEKMLK
jgi:hypothetical protein